MSSSRPWTLAVLAASFAAALALPAPAMAAELALDAAQAQALGIRFAPVENASALQANVSARAVLRPDAQYVVAAPYAGMVSQITVAIGQTVKKGQPLASFASPQLFEASRALAEARSQAELAQLAMNRDRQLHEDGIIARSRWESTQARAREAQAMLRARQAELLTAGLAINSRGEARLVAGRDGLVAEIHAVPGTRVEASAPLFRIVDAGALELDLLLGRDFPALHGGERVEVPQHQARGKVSGMVPAADGSGALRVRVTLEERGSLRSGDNVAALIRFAASEPKAARLRVPVAALAYVQGKPGLFIATARGVQWQAVEVDASDGVNATVHGPLSAQARVAVAGVGALKGMLAGGQ